MDSTLFCFDIITGNRLSGDISYAACLSCISCVFFEIKNAVGTVSSSRTSVNNNNKKPVYYLQIYRQSIENHERLINKSICEFFF